MLCDVKRNSPPAAFCTEANTPLPPLPPRLVPPRKKDRDTNTTAVMHAAKRPSRARRRVQRGVPRRRLFSENISKFHGERVDEFGGV